MCRSLHLWGHFSSSPSPHLLKQCDASLHLLMYPPSEEQYLLQHLLPGYSKLLPHPLQHHALGNKMRYRLLRSSTQWTVHANKTLPPLQSQSIRPTLEQGPDYRRVVKLRDASVRTKEKLSNACKFGVCNYQKHLQISLALLSRYYRCLLPIS